MSKSSSPQPKPTPDHSTREMSPLEYITSLQESVMLPGNHRLEAVLAELGNPEREVPAIHVGGTNGKGSVSAFLASILGEAGIKTGLFTSPHLISFTERIQVDLREPTPPQLEHLVGEVRRASRAGGVQLSFFEFATAMAFLHFREQGVQVVIMEVGLGGKLDATSLCNPMVSVIVTIGLDHCHILGHTLEEIAREKGGIIRPGVPVVSGVVGGAGQVIARVAEELGSPLILAGDAAPKPGGAGPRRGDEWSLYLEPVEQVEQVSIRAGAGGGLARGRVVERGYPAAAGGDPVNGLEQTTLTLGIRGKHQLHNCACAIAALRAVSSRVHVPVSALIRGVKNSFWPARLQEVPASPSRNRPAMLIDGAHNGQGAVALAEYLEEAHPSRKKVLLTSILKRKDARAILHTLGPLCEGGLVLVDVSEESGQDAWSPGELAELIPTTGRFVPVHQVSSLGEGLNLAGTLAGPEGLIVAAGSLYLAGLLLKELGGLGGGRKSQSGFGGS